MRALHELWNRLLVRPCRGCDDTSYHTAHLTRLGRWYYIDRHPTIKQEQP